jgi:benzoyl-CoA reductase subunit C
MPSVLEQMSSSVRDAPAVLQEIKNRTGRKMIGFFHPVVPEELIYAAGLRPVRLFPYLADPIIKADAYLQTYLCSYVRAYWDQTIRGRYPYLDGVIIPRSCEPVTFLYQTWKRHNPYQFIDYINVPWKRSDNAISFFAKELGRIKEGLERFTEKEISEDSLRHAISVCNRNRELLRKVYDSRKAESPPLSGAEAFSVVMSSFVLDKEEHSGLMEQLLSELARRTQPPQVDIRLLISGGCVIDTRLWEMIESSGVSIVSDDVNNGSRSFWYSVEETKKDPLETLAEAYAMVPCAFNTSIAHRFDYLLHMMREYRVNGVIFAANKNCESEKFVYPELNRRIKDTVSVPTLNIETDYLIDMAPLRNRVEAFIETLRA